MKIYIVGAEIDDDDYHVDWNVRAFTDKALAEDLKTKAQARAKEMRKTLADLRKARNFGAADDFRKTAQNEFDPSMQWGLNDFYPSYYVTETELEGI